MNFREVLFFLETFRINGGELEMKALLPRRYCPFQFATFSFCMWPPLRHPHRHLHQLRPPLFHLICETLMLYDVIPGQPAELINDMDEFLQLNGYVFQHDIAQKSEKGVSIEVNSGCKGNVDIMMEQSTRALSKLCLLLHSATFFALSLCWFHVLFVAFPILP
jgi:hypothetical protein